MAQIKSQKKRIITNEKARQENISKVSKMRTAIKKCKSACALKDVELATSTLPAAIALIDESVSSGLQHINTANRQKSSLAKAVNSISEVKAE